MGGSPFAERLTEPNVWYREAHHLDFPVMETRETLGDKNLPIVLGYPTKWDRGKEFRLAKNGAVILKPGYYVETRLITAVLEDTITKVIEIGNQATFETPSGTTVTEDQFQGGFYQVRDHTGKGHSFPIAGNTAGGAPPRRIRFKSIWRLIPRSKLTRPRMSTS